MEVSPETEVEGSSAIAALAMRTPVLSELRWIALAAPSQTGASIELQLEGQSVLYHQGGYSVCSFIQAPCPHGFEVEIGAHLITGDGAVMATFQGRTEGLAGPHEAHFFGTLEPKNVAGTLFEQPFIDPDGVMVEPEEIRLSVSWADEADIAPDVWLSASAQDDVLYLATNVEFGPQRPGL